MFEFLCALIDYVETETGDTYLEENWLNPNP